MNLSLPYTNLKIAIIFFSFLVLPVIGFSQVKLDSGLVGYFMMDNNSGDSSITAVHGVGTGVVSTFGINNDSNSAYNFNGTTSFIDCSTNARSITNTVSVSYWLKTTGSVTTNEFTIEKYNWHVDKGFYMGVKYGYPYIGVRNTSGYGSHTWSASGTNLVNDGTWHHILGVVSINSIQFWIDGQLEATNTLSASTPNLVNNRPLSIGYYWEGNQDNHFDGDLDEIRLYNRVLTTDEIKYLSTKNFTYATISPSVCGPLTSPSTNYTWTTSGTYQDTIPNTIGGDSVITVNLTVLTNSFTTISPSACGSYTSPSGNNTWINSGTYSDTLVNSVGCDSILTINLTVNNNLTTTVSPTSCGPYNSPSGNYVWTTSGTYYDTIPVGNGCDFLFTVNLTVNSPTSSTSIITSCDSYTSPSGNYIWTNSGIYYDTIPNAWGCDSLMTFNLTVNQSSSSIISPSVCSSYASPSGNNTWTSSGTYTDVILNSAGCDSTITINLSVNNSFATISPTACNSYTSPSGKLWTASGIYQDTIVNSLGCDSIMTINLTVGTNSLTTENVSSCSSYIWPVNGLTYLNSGTHTEILSSTLGCDSVVVLNLTITQPTNSTINVTACDSYVSPSGTNTWTGPGIYTDVISNNAGCDSTITINLTINHSSNSLQTVSSCGPYLWSVNGLIYPVGGIYVVTIPNSVGCDSVITLNLTINSASSSTVNVTNCGSYPWAQNGITYNASGQYLDTASNSVGCDSVITLNLTINNPSTGTETVTACNSYTSPSGNYNWTASGTYLDTILNSTGCDSVITTTLIINTVTSSVQTVMSCDNYYWTVNNQTYIASGSYMDTTINALGCDSIITLNLTINNSYASTVTQTECNTYTWPLNGVTYTISGNYSDTMVAVTGCDSIITLNLQINSSDSVVENVISCGSYLWSTTGNLYTTSGSFQAMLSNTYGCDSVVTLNLVITLPSTDTIPMIVCDSYQWVLNGNTYTMSGFYIDSLTSVSGCDSLIILDLTINESSTGILTENSCGAYTAPDGSLFTTSGQYTVIIPNSTGCDSVITVNLTVTNIDTTVTKQGFELTAVDTGYSYQWLDCEKAMSPIVGATSISFIPSVNGSYAVEITDRVCVETSSCHKVTGVGVEVILLSGIVVYPNPVYDELKVINERQLSLEIRVLDLTGKQVGFRKTNAERTAFDLSDLPSGIYLIQIKSDSLFMTKKVTVR